MFVPQAVPDDWLTTLACMVLTESLDMRLRNSCPKASAERQPITSCKSVHV